MNTYAVTITPRGEARRIVVVDHTDMEGALATVKAQLPELAGRAGWLIFNAADYDTARMPMDYRRAMYTAGKYRFDPPPVDHAQWSEDDWITFIDAGQRWTVFDERV